MLGILRPFCVWTDAVLHFVEFLNVVRNLCLPLCVQWNRMSAATSKNKRWSKNKMCAKRWKFHLWENNLSCNKSVGIIRLCFRLIYWLVMFSISNVLFCLWISFIIVRNVLSVRCSHVFEMRFVNLSTVTNIFIGFGFNWNLNLIQFSSFISAHRYFTSHSFRFPSFNINNKLFLDHSLSYFELNFDSWIRSEPDFR